MKRLTADLAMVIGALFLTPDQVLQPLARAAAPIADADMQASRQVMAPAWAGSHREIEAACSDEIDWENNQIMNIMGRWWLPQLGDGAHLSTVHSSEQPNYGGDIFEGRMFYIPAGSGAGTMPLYRLQSVPLLDHMDSLSTNEAGYQLEGPLGNPYAMQQPGTSQIKRWVRTTPYFDHMTTRDGEVPAGYSHNAFLGYGYPRYNVGQPQHCAENVVVQGGLLRLAFNKAAGGILWELKWKNKQFINDWEYGRQIQSAVFLGSGSCLNPTEGGDSFENLHPQCDFLGPWTHGSPLISYEVHSVPGSGPAITTVTRPSQWYVNKLLMCPNPQEPCDVDHPVLWNGKISKTVTLNHLNHPTWLRWDASFTMAGDWPTAGFTIAAGAFVDDFDELYGYDAETDTLSDNKTKAVLGTGNCLFADDPEDGQGLAPTIGGMIAASHEHDYAIGLYHRSGQGFSNIGAFGLCASIPSGFPDDQQHGQYGVNTYGWTVGTAAAVVNGAAYGYTVYIVVGTLDGVVSVKWWKSRDASPERVTTLPPDLPSACPSIRRVL